MARELWVISSSTMLSLTSQQGTADFCAVEVASGLYLIPEKTASPTILADDNDGDQPSAPVPIAGPDLQQDDWRFRDVHDLESIFWLILWLSFVVAMS